LFDLILPNNSRTFPLLEYIFYSIQGDFEGCTDILTCERTPQKAMIEPIMPYANIDIFREKGAKIKKKKTFFCCHLIQH
jgi:hypothetical protein